MVTDRLHDFAIWARGRRDPRIQPSSQAQRSDPFPSAPDEIATPAARARNDFPEVFCEATPAEWLHSMFRICVHRGLYPLERIGSGIQQVQAGEPDDETCVGIRLRLL